VLVTLKVVLLSAVWAGILKIQTSGIQAEINIIKAITTLVVVVVCRVFGVGWQRCGQSFLPVYYIEEVGRMDAQISLKELSALKLNNRLMKSEQL